MSTNVVSTTALISADLPGKKRQGKKGKRGEIQENCKKGRWKIENGRWKSYKTRNEERFLFVFVVVVVVVVVVVFVFLFCFVLFCFVFCFFVLFFLLLKYVLGLSKWKFSTGKKHFTPGKNQEK